MMDHNREYLDPERSNELRSTRGHHKPQSELPPIFRSLCTCCVATDMFRRLAPYSTHHNPFKINHVAWVCGSFRS